MSLWGWRGAPLRKTRFTEVQMVVILREADETPVAKVAAAGWRAASSCSVIVVTTGPSFRSCVSVESGGSSGIT